MSPKLLRGLALVDIVGLPLVVGWYIWRGQLTTPHSWLVFPAWLLASFALHRDTPKTLGWRADNLGTASCAAAALFAVLAALVIAAGLALGAPRHVPPNLASLGRLWSYFVFCLVQQVALQSLLNNRLMAVIARRWVSSLAAGAIFAALHWPNPVLVPLTFIGGTALAWLFARERNILPLAAGQAILGTLVWWAFPLAWHHSLRVGPGYYRPL